MRSFARRIIEWQRQHGRHGLPWQGADSYRVWLSEIMLQQTQVATVVPYYRRFVTSFPDVAALAAASEDKVLAHWSGLGYYSRARNLHRAAQLIMQRHGGAFPHYFDDILALPGIGRSTAAAISAFAFRERRAILDGNVKRVLARYCAIEGYSGMKEVELQLWQQAEALLPKAQHAVIPAKAGIQSSNRTGLPPSPKVGNPLPAEADVELTPRERRAKGLSSNSGIAAYTQGLMDLGALLCTRSKPQCALCPLQKDCVAYQSGRVAELPTPRPRKALPEKHSTFLLLLDGPDILLEKRPGSGIWGGLWCPPQFENVQAALDGCARMGIEVEKVTRHSGEGRNLDKLKIKCEALPSFTHTFTHFKLHIAPLVVQVARKPKQVQEPGRVWLNLGDALCAAIPSPVRKLIEKIIRG